MQVSKRKDNAGFKVVTDNVVITYAGACVPQVLSLIKKTKEERLDSWLGETPHINELVGEQLFLKIMKATLCNIKDQDELLILLHSYTSPYHNGYDQITSIVNNKNRLIVVSRKEFFLDEKE